MAIEDNKQYTLSGEQWKEVALRIKNAQSTADGKADKALEGDAAPTAATAAEEVGQLYYDTTNDQWYICSEITPQGTDPETYTYTWTSVGSKINVVQTIGTSTTNVMSQKAVTGMIASKVNAALDPDTIWISGGTHEVINDQRFGIYLAPNMTSLPSSVTRRNILIGTYVYKPGADKSIAIGASVYTGFVGEESVAVGFESGASGGSQPSNYSVMVGSNARVSSLRHYGTALGTRATVSQNGGIALGAYSSASAQGEMNIGSTQTAYGYNNSAYRLLTGVYDGQSAHDAATVGQLNRQVLKNAGAPTTATVGEVGTILSDTTNHELYLCTAVEPQGTDPETYHYIWEPVVAEPISHEGAPTESTEGEIGQLYVDTLTGDIYYLSAIEPESDGSDTYIWNSFGSSEVISTQDWNALWVGEIEDVNGVGL